MHIRAQVGCTAPTIAAQRVRLGVSMASCFSLVLAKQEASQACRWAAECALPTLYAG